VTSHKLHKYFGWWFIFFIYTNLDFFFVARIPICLIPLWLLRVYVEAPIRGSMVLVDVLFEDGWVGLL
jgi:NADH:ubiquinone oxidoreductase subunit 4 (subunit M)